MLGDLSFWNVTLGIGASVCTIGLTVWGVWKWWFTGSPVACADPAPDAPSISPPATLTPTPAASEKNQICDSIRSMLYERMGEKARLEYFQKVTQNESEYSRHYYDTVRGLADDQTWWRQATAVMEWANIGYITFRENGGSDSQSLKNRLYAAAIRVAMQQEDPMFQVGDQLPFVRHVRGIVRCLTTR